MKLSKLHPLRQLAFLAFFGGEKTINFKQPPWYWPPKSQGKIDIINKYYEYQDLIKQYLKCFEKVCNILSKHKFLLAYK